MRQNPPRAEQAQHAQACGAEVFIRPITQAEVEAVIALWHRCGLVRPWNPPREDIARAAGKENSELLVGMCDGRPIATVMVGHDGHRGWLYYLAVEPEVRRRGIGRAMVRAAEGWLAARGVPKVQLLVRAENAATTAFYRRIGYREQPVVVLGRFLADAR